MRLFQRKYRQVVRQDFHLNFVVKKVIWFFWHFYLEWQVSGLEKVPSKSSPPGQCKFSCWERSFLSSIAQQEIEKAQASNYPVTIKLLTKTTCNDLGQAKNESCFSKEQDGIKVFCFVLCLITTMLIGRGKFPLSLFSSKHQSLIKNSYVLVFHAECLAVSLKI